MGLCHVKLKLLLQRFRIEPGMSTYSWILTLSITQSLSILYSVKLSDLMFHLPYLHGSSACPTSNAQMSLHLENSKNNLKPILLCKWTRRDTAYLEKDILSDTQNCAWLKHKWPALQVCVQVWGILLITLDQPQTVVLTAIDCIRHATLLERMCRHLLSEFLASSWNPFHQVCQFWPFVSFVGVKEVPSSRSFFAPCILSLTAFFKRLVAALVMSCHLGWSEGQCGTLRASPLCSHWPDKWMSHKHGTHTQLCSWPLLLHGVDPVDEQFDIHPPFCVHPHNIWNWVVSCGCSLGLFRKDGSPRRCC